MKVVFDTNVLLVSISKKSKYRPIFDSVLNGTIDLLITNEIISEYSEIIGRKTNEIVSNNGTTTNLVENNNARLNY